MTVVSTSLMVAGLITVTYGLTSYDNSEAAPARCTAYIALGLGLFAVGGYLLP